MNLPEILFYNLESSKGFKLEKLCKRLGIQVRYVKEEEYQVTLEYLCGFTKEAGEKQEVGIIAEEMFIMVGFTDELLERFLKEFKTMHIELVQLKAVLTEHNREWTSYALYQELCKERDYYSGKVQK